MKKMLMFIVLLIIPINAKALSVNLNCPSSVNIGQNITCNIFASDPQGISGASGSISYSNANLTSFLTSSIWQGGTNGNSFTIYTSTAKNGTANIGTINLVANNSGNVSVSATINEISDANDNLKAGGRASAIIKVNSNQSSEAKPVINNNSSLNKGNNNSQNMPNQNKDNSISNENNPSNDNSLKKIIVNGKEISIEDKMIVNLAYDQKELKIDYELNSDKATAKILEEDKNLKVGNNIYHLEITAEDGNVKTYELNINRQPKKYYTENNPEKLLADLDDDTLSKIYLKLDLKNKNILSKDVLNKLSTLNKNLIVEMYDNKKLIYILTFKNNFDNLKEDLNLNINFTQHNKKISKILQKQKYIYFLDNDLNFPYNTQILFYPKNYIQAKYLTLAKYFNSEINDINNHISNKSVELKPDYLNNYLLYENKVLVKTNHFLPIILLLIVICLIGGISIILLKKRRINHENK